MIADEHEPCVVCGAPGGNCGPGDGSHDDPSPVTFSEWGRDYRPPQARRVQMGDVVAAERIWEELPVPRSRRTRRVLRYRAGAIVPRADAERLNVDDDGRQTSVPRAAVDDTGLVPLSQGERDGTQDHGASAGPGDPGEGATPETAAVGDG